MRKTSNANRSFALVWGTLPFPFDMLRYDQCWPALEEDMGQLSARPGEGKLRIVLVTKYDEGKHNWTEGRWNSFSWGIQIMGSHMINHREERARILANWEAKRQA